MKCERCGAGTSEYDLHDYCAKCSKNLCMKCAAEGCCGNKPMVSGMEADENAPPIKREVRNRRLTQKEASGYNEIREHVAEELPELIARHEARAGRKKAMIYIGFRKDELDSTGYNRGEKFKSEAEVVEYFTAKNLRAMFGDHCHIPDQEVLENMATHVIFHRDHCNF